jgi:hypothetical protein
MTDDAVRAAELRAALRPVAALGVTLTYAQAAEALALDGPGRIARVTAALERLMAEDAAAGAPFLAALVVGRRRGGLPAPGFFEAAARLGRLPPGADPAAFHAAEARAAAAFHGRPR